MRNYVSITRGLPFFINFSITTNYKVDVMRNLVKIAVAALLLTPALAISGVVDTPLGSFTDGKKAKLVYSVPGVISNQGGLETSFHCTNLDSKPIDLGVEVFQWDGTQLNSIATNTGVVIGVAVGQQFTLSTGPTAAFSDDIVILGGTVVNQGSARIVSTSTKIICSATMVSATGTPPTSLTSLPVLKGKTQKGN
jgi:hypothetical protein